MMQIENGEDALEYAKRGLEELRRTEIECSWRLAQLFGRSRQTLEKYRHNKPVNDEERRVLREAEALCIGVMLIKKGSTDLTEKLTEEQRELIYHAVSEPFWNRTKAVYDFWRLITTIMSESRDQQQGTSNSQLAHDALVILEEIENALAVAQYLGLNPQDLSG